MDNDSNRSAWRTINPPPPPSSQSSSNTNTYLPPLPPMSRSPPPPMSYGHGHGHHGLPMHPSQSTTRPPMAPLVPMAPMAPMAPMPQPPPALSHHAPTRATAPSIPGKNFDISRYPSPSAASKFVLSDPTNGAQAQDLANRMAAASPEVVRHVVRNHFETICTGSEYHMYFILSVIMREASPDMLRTFIKEFGGRIARECSVEIASNWSAAEIDDLAPYILPRCGSAFLDRALETRFRTIPAQSLVNYLARAQRLGYEESDIVDNTTIPPMVAENNAPAQSQQSGLPEIKEQTMAPTPRMSAPVSSGPPLPSQAPAASGIVLPPIQSSSVIASVPTLREEATKLGVVYCQHCDRPCSGKAALVHHNKKSPCVGWTHGVVGKDVCINCGQRFDGNGGLAYHTNHMVCGVYPENVIIKMEQLLRTAYEFANRRGNPDPLRSSYSTGSINGSQLSPSRSAYITTPGSPSSDPYASLTMEQREALQKEIQTAENKFADRMKDAMVLSAPERDVRLANLKNGLNNKQSMIRKKYGIRLRGRRTRADMQAERDRMIGSTFPTVGRSGRRRSRSPMRAASMHLGSTASMSQDRRRSVGSELSLHGRTGHEIISVDSTPSPPRRVTMGGDRFASPSPLASQVPSQAHSQADDMDRMEVDEASRLERAHRHEPEERLAAAYGSERGGDSHYTDDDSIREPYSGEPQQKRMRVDEAQPPEHPARRESNAEARRSPVGQAARHEGETATANHHAAQITRSEHETERTTQHAAQDAGPSAADKLTSPATGADDDQMDISDSEAASSQQPKERDGGFARKEAPLPARAEGADNETERRDASRV